MIVNQWHSETINQLECRSEGQSIGRSWLILSECHWLTIIGELRSLWFIIICRFRNPKCRIWKLFFPISIFSGICNMSNLIDEQEKEKSIVLDRILNTTLLWTLDSNGKRKLPDLNSVPFCKEESKVKAKTYRLEDSVNHIFRNNRWKILKLLKLEKCHFVKNTILCQNAPQLKIANWVWFFNHTQTVHDWKIIPFD